MLFVKKVDKSVDMELVNEIVRAYLDGIRANQGVANIDLSGKDIVELFRYCLCRALDLQTKENILGGEEFYQAVGHDLLMPIVTSGNLYAMSTEHRHGLLEACIHCLVLARKRANV